MKQSQESLRLGLGADAGNHHFNQGSADLDMQDVFGAPKASARTNATPAPLSPPGGMGLGGFGMGGARMPPRDPEEVTVINANLM